MIYSSHPHGCKVLSKNWEENCDLRVRIWCTWAPMITFFNKSKILILSLKNIKQIFECSQLFIPQILKRYQVLCAAVQLSLLATKGKRTPRRSKWWKIIRVVFLSYNRKWLKVWHRHVTEFPPPVYTCIHFECQIGRSSWRKFEDWIGRLRAAHPHFPIKKF
jgi:hypothetical protein